MAAKWEYCNAHATYQHSKNVVLVVDDQGTHTYSSANVFEILNQLGDSGWEAFAVDGGMTWLKRQKS